jgi:UDP-N-acetylglucosamine acyltransferase
VIEGHTTIGRDCRLFPFAVIGGEPQHTAFKGEVVELIIGERNLIREHVTMHPGTPFGSGRTIVGNDGNFYVGSHVAHDSVIGNSVIFINHAVIGGHVHVDDFAILGGSSAVHQRVRVGKHAMIGGMTGVESDIIPYGSVWGNHAHLEGLNLVGLKRRGFSREAINNLRAAYRLMFADEGTFQERLDDTIEVYQGSAEVMEIVNFIRSDANRPICLPHD